MKPFLKWAGGKTRLLSQYNPYFPERIKYYYEPFLGSGSVYFHLQDRIMFAELSDVNNQLVNAFKVVKSNPYAVIDRLKKYEINHSANQYYTVRSINYRRKLERDCDTIGLAARFIYLNKTCYNGLYRENSKGGFNVPIGRYVNPLICDEPTILNASEALSGTIIFSESYDVLFKKILNFPIQFNQSFFYFDPPYHPIGATANFTSYTRKGFDMNDQIKLAQIARSLTELGGTVMVSNSDCGFIRNLYSDFNLIEINMRRSINSMANKRVQQTELLILNYA
jgi:DNA adenine methylase